MPGRGGDEGVLLGGPARRGTGHVAAVCGLRGQSGIPVVGVAGGAVSELVPPEAGRIAPRLDAAVFAQTVREFVREVDLEEAGRQARAWVERRYAWPAVLPGLLEHYRALCGVPSLLPVPVAAEVADAWQGGR